LGTFEPVRFRRSGWVDGDADYNTFLLLYYYMKVFLLLHSCFSFFSGLSELRHTRSWWSSDKLDIVTVSAYVSLKYGSQTTIKGFSSHLYTIRFYKLATTETS